jgi:hypothetical protein
MGEGANHKVTGLVITMVTVSVELVQLEQTGVGTADLKLNYLSLGLQPRFNKQATEHLLQDIQNSQVIIENCFPLMMVKLPTLKECLRGWMFPTRKECLRGWILPTRNECLRGYILPTWNECQRGCGYFATGEPSSFRKS